MNFDSVTIWFLIWTTFCYVFGWYVSRLRKVKKVKKVKTHRKEANMKVNLNTLAVEVTKLEGKKHNLSIGDVKEVLALVFKAMKKMTLAEIMDIISRYK